MDAPPPDRRRARHIETRAQILAAAWQLANEHGLTGWSLREVAGVVGMRAPSLYVYFDSKDAIFDAMFAHGYDQLLDRIAAQRTIDEPPAQRARRAARLFVDFCVEDPARFQLLFLRVIPGFEPSPDAYARAQQVLDALRDLLAEVGIDDPQAIDLWTAVMSGLAAQQISNEPGGQRWVRLVDHAADRFLTGAQP